MMEYAAALLHPVFNPNYCFIHCIYPLYLHYLLSTYLADILVVITTLLALHCLQILLILSIFQAST